MKPIYYFTNKGTKSTHPILFNSISFSYKKAKCQNNRVFHTLHLPIVTLFKIWQWTCLVKQLLCPSGDQRCGCMEQFSASHCYQHPVLLSLKNNLKTNGFLTDNAAKAKCPVWGKGSEGKMVIGLSWCVDNDETHWITQRTTLAAPVNKTNTIVLSLWKGVA